MPIAVAADAAAALFKNSLRSMDIEASLVNHQKAEVLNVFLCYELTHAL
jgi:hypothetical protein